MASPGQSSLFTTFTELVTTTYRNHKKEVADNVSNHNALFRRLTQKGKVRREDGGLSIVEALEYAENSTYTRYSGYDPLNVDAVDVLSAAEYPWRQVSVNVAASGLEIRSNSGENRIVNLVKTKIKNAQKSMANGLAEDLYSAGSLSNQIGGLQALIADAGTGTVGGINSSTAAFAFWKNVVQSAASPLQGGSSITPASNTIESLMLPLWLRLTRGSDAPDLVVMSEDYFTFFEQSQTSLKRYAPEDNGQAGMVAMKYKTADVVHDSSASGIPAAHGYFINTDYLELVVHQDAEMEIMPELRSINQDAVIIPVIFQGNLVCSNRKLQGVMKA
jgi:hypothetical protein